MPSGSTFPVVPVAPQGGIGVGFPMPHPGDGSTDFTKTEMVTPETSLNMSVGAFLASLGLEKLREIFEREQISVDILAEMNHEDLKQIGVTAYGHRHKLIKGIEKLVSGKGNNVNFTETKEKFCKLQITLAPAIWQPPPSVSSQSTVLVDISPEDAEFRAVEEEMQSSIREHRDQVKAKKLSINGFP